MSPADFLKEVRKGKRYEMVVLRGNEELLLREALQEYLDKIVSPDSAAFDFTEFRGSEMDGGTLWNAVTTLPLLSERRVVLWDVAGEIKPDVAEALGRYAARPSPTTSLIVVLGPEAREGRLSAARAAAKITDVEFREMRENERASWAEAYAKRHGKTLEEEALRYVVETSSKSLSDSAAKLDHVMLYIGESKEITVQALMKVSGVSSEYTVFDLDNAIIARRPAEAIRVACSLLEGGEVILRLLAFHRGRVLKLWQVKSLLKKSSSPEATAEGIDVFGKWKPPTINAYKRAARQTDARVIHDAITGLLEVEVRAKSESQDPYYYFEWLWRFASNAAVSKEPNFRIKS